MDRETLQAMIEQAQKEREALIAEANHRLAYLNGVIDAYQKVYEGLHGKHDERPDPTGG